MQHTGVLFFAVVLSASVAQAAENFQRKSGLWELKRKSSVTSEQTRVYQMCIDQASDNALTPLAEGSPGENCEVGKLQRDESRINVDATCKLPQTSVVATTHAVISGKFDSAYRIESKTTFAPALRGHTGSTSVLEAKWTGPCKPDQRPGDVIGPRGEKFNVASQNARGEKAAAPDKGNKVKRGRYVAPEPPPGSQPTPAVPLPGARPK